MTYISYGGAGFASTPVAPNSFTFTQTVSADLTTEYDVGADATANGWDGIKPLLATITVSAKLKGVARTSSDTYAFDTGVLPAGSYVDVIVTSSGKIWGGGGKGGDGDGNIGITGGTAMNFRVNGSVTINAGGEVVSGSGGGGGGGSKTRIVNGEEIVSASSGGGGGWPNGAAGASGSTPGAAGSAGTETGGGAGGTSGTSGGNGGNKNASATAGEAASGQGVGGQGGDAGQQGVAIKKNSNSVTVSNAGTLYGNPAEQA